ncbi:DUF2089 domain-containing protein [Actinoplanes sp. NBC_00393]|uniref:DUF2089 domain-containing protein n=1 Tax=Actinoplanes sp. NBC_00393 TaxID=2975953 RepID=UPI002E21D974
MDWQDLTDLTQGQPFTVERVRLTGNGVAIEGQFEPPQLAQLNADDQVFVAAFVRAHGSIKEMERIFGVSYPTIKSRLNRIAGNLAFAEHLDFAEPESGPAAAGADVVDRLQRGELTVQQALDELKRSR